MTVNSEGTPKGVLHDAYVVHVSTLTLLLPLRAAAYLWSRNKPTFAGIGGMPLSFIESPQTLSGGRPIHNEQKSPGRVCNFCNTTRTTQSSPWPLLQTPIPSDTQRLSPGICFKLEKASLTARKCQRLVSLPTGWRPMP